MIRTAKMLAVGVAVGALMLALAGSGQAGDFTIGFRYDSGYGPYHRSYSYYGYYNHYRHYYAPYGYGYRYYTYSQPRYYYWGSAPVVVYPAPVYRYHHYAPAPNYCYPQYHGGIGVWFYGW